MALTLRFATARDIAAIARVCVESLPDDPTFDYLWRYRHEYPEDNYFFWLQRLKGNLFDPDMTCLVVAKPHYKGAEETVVSVGLWRRHGSTQAARQWQKQGWLDWIQGLTTSVENWANVRQYQRRDADMPRVEAFEQVMDEVYDIYWRKAFRDNWHLELLFTHPEHRKQGAATKIVQWGLTQAEMALTWDLRASLGFVLIEKRTVKVDGDKAELVVLVMHKPSSQ
ncbi:hypothetical protein Z517_10882 [Fonsecaea pedrosoi CBS 271.37]|uniref:Unplaced genomic scaffold supercont1.7, whole genome shotgun sequence n=1 Tax=Fonsecaea pedrosoi CBS 271.37 TaxID=1442368 RepID=A0A0D2EP31_9EURO|nr:uncharacterized protein Z517_10882 [Fonsecaea pedrosoi CBS 271.37]KIW76137.1 hypothetical protein Z517_10882 [Fonsecaea pedrosoi CBS 271.37]